MSALSETGFTLAYSLSSLYLAIVVLRGILQASRADFFNPISQFVVRATHPPLSIMRKVIPSGQRVDLSIIALAFIVQFLGIQVTLLAGGYAFADPVTATLWSLLGIVGLVINIYLYVLIGSIIISWVAAGSRHPAVLLTYQITEPVMAPVRSVIPAMGGLDFSPIVIFIVINLLQNVLGQMAIAVGLPARLVIGL